MFPWEAEISIKPETAASLARETFGFSVDKIAYLGEGWDYITYLVDGSWVLRFPKRADCDRALLREKSILDVLNQAAIPLAVPEFRYLGEPCDRFPWHFVAYPIIEGVPLNTIPGYERLPAVPESIGRFLAALHEIATAEPFDDPWADEEDETDWRQREFELSAAAYPRPLRKAMEQYLVAPQPEAPDLPKVLAHADLNAEHIIVDPTSKRVTGVIDWGDCYTTIRTIDYVGLYYLGGRESVERAFTAAGVTPRPDEWPWLWNAAVAMCIGQVFYGHKDNHPQLVAEGVSRAAKFLGVNEFD